MTLGFAAVSKDSSFRLNSVFSSCLGAASSSSTGDGGLCGAGWWCAEAAYGHVGDVEAGLGAGLDGMLPASCT